MANQANTYDPFEQFDREYEAAHAPEIAFANWKINWDHITPENALPVVFSATIGHACRVMEILARGASR